MHSECIIDIFLIYLVTTFARIFVNQETTEMYLRVLQFFFSLLKDRFQIDIRWYHLHGSGFRAIIMDQDPKQYAGIIYSEYIPNIFLMLLGIAQYLSSIDPLHRHWHWQMKHSIVFCLIHFQRGIKKLVPSNDMSSTSMYAQMMDLPNCKSREEYILLCDLLIGNRFLIL